MRLPVSAGLKYAEIKGENTIQYIVNFSKNEYFYTQINTF